MRSRPWIFLGALVLLMGPQSPLAQTLPEIVVMMRHHAGRDSDLDARPLDDSELDLLERVARVELEPRRIEESGAQVLALGGPVDPDSLRSILADLRALPDVLYAEPVPSGPPVPKARSAETRDLIESLAWKPSSRVLRDRADQGLPLEVGVEEALRAVAGVELTFDRPAAGGIYILKLPQPMAFPEAEAIAARLEADGSTSYAEPVRHAQPQLVPNDPFYPFQWHYFEPPGGANLPGAWDVTIGAEGVVIAVVDTGVLFGHPDLVGRLLPGYDFISSPVRSNDGTGRDADASDSGNWNLVGECGPGSPAQDSTWHGTHVAGTIGAASFNGIGVAGVNWVSPMLPIRVLGRCGGDWADIADAIRWAAGLSVPGVPFDNVYPARVINLSLGSFIPTCPQFMQDAITAVVATGSVVIVAAGNQTDFASLYTPANCSGVVAVHANTSSGGYAPYSNFGVPPIDISAPGGDTSYMYAGPLGVQPYDGVLSSIGFGATTAIGYDFAFRDGTSVAAPHVAGVASLILSLNDELTPGQVETILELSAFQFPVTPVAQCDTATCGAGILDGLGAVAITPEREGLDFYPIAPCRLVDTREGFGAIPQFHYGTFYGDGLCGVPLGAKAISAIVTAAGTTGAGHFRVWPTDRPLPEASSINFQIGPPRANNAFIRLSKDGEFSVYRGGGPGATHFIVDVTGYFR